MLNKRQMVARAVSYWDNDRYFYASDFPSADTLTGTAQDDYLDSGGSDDTLIGGTGSDNLFAGSGDDI